MSVVDFTETIIAKSDQLNAADIAGSMTITITDAKTLKGNDQPIHIFYEGGGNKPWKPCKSMRRVMATLWGAKVDLKGRQVTLVCDPTVTWAGQEVGGIRITHMSHIDGKRTIPVRASKHVVKQYMVLPIVALVYDDNLKAKGDEAAANGVEAYTAWLASLTPEQKEPLKKFHAQWTAKAKEADKNDELPAF